MRPTVHHVAPHLRRELAIDDLRRGLQQWRIWWLLGIGDVRQRYRRSRLGQFWITLSMAIFVSAIGVVYAILFRQPISEYLPYIATTYVVWTLISGVGLESTVIFQQSENFIRQEPLPRSTFILRMLVRNYINFAHNIVLIPAVFLFFGKGPFWTWLLVPLGLLLIAIVSFVAGLLCALLCARFRDLPQIVGNLMQVAFFISPVMWRPEALQEQAWYVVGLNPFAAFLRVVSEPMLGRVPGALTYLSTVVAIAVLAAVTWPLFVRFRARIVYWL